MTNGCGVEGHDEECLCDVKLEGPEPQVLYVPDCVDGEGSPIEALLDWWGRTSSLLDNLAKAREVREAEADEADGRRVVVHKASIENAALKGRALELTAQGLTLAATAARLEQEFGRTVDHTTISRWRRNDGQGASHNVYTDDEKAWAVTHVQASGSREVTRAAFLERYGKRVGVSTLSTWVTKLKAAA